jgi:hypothetical protein
LQQADSPCIFYFYLDCLEDFREGKASKPFPTEAITIAVGAEASVDCSFHRARSEVDLVVHHLERKASLVID